MFTKLAIALRDRTIRRAPDVCIGGDGTEAGCYMRRWWVVPRNKLFNIYLHCVQHDDDDRALHTHPWWNVSWLIEGRYVEIVPGDDSDRAKATPTKHIAVMRNVGELVWRGTTTAHRLKLVPGDRECWTVFITGPKLTGWGFWCRHKDGSPRFVDWKIFTGKNERNGPVRSAPSRTGLGCGEVD